ncbi:MAG: carbohydrate binding family 9 domain-containing protein [Gemmatimonadetes bacterium]|nr:carbohydrate binding family 9 domain-containing protein [Gemmatimonadota bacterium]
MKKLYAIPLSHPAIVARSVRTRGALVYCFALSLTMSTAAVAQESPDSGDGAYAHEDDAPTIGAVRTDRPVDLDGRLDEPAWDAASVATGFTQIDPEEGEPASQRTEVRVLYDDVALYVGARLHDDGEVRTRLGRRDEIPPDSDSFTVSIDSRHDHRTAYRFQTNPSAVRADVVEGASYDPSWDPVWDVATSVDEAGWTAEMRIPFSQLRFGDRDVQRWGIQFVRRIARRAEGAMFAFTPREERGGVPRYGHLTELEAIPPGSRLEVLPYLRARSEHVDVDPDDPFRDDPHRDWAVGADLKYRLTSAITLDATVNPDFGQVELDPAVVNLSAFETFFSEKRPFFIEGADIFAFGGGGFFGGTQLFYSRRIGRQPQGTRPTGAVFVDVPDATTILGAAKVTGKTAGGWSIGVLDAFTPREFARFETAEGERGELAVEPPTNYFVSRLRKDLREGRTVVGAMATSVVRDVEEESLRGALRSSAWSGGLDFEHEFADRTWELGGFVSASHVRGEPEVILAAQRSSARYYQRPDADHVEIDSTRTSLSGASGELRLSKIAGLHWRGRLSLEATSPGYEINDLGFQSVADRAEANAFVAYREPRPGETLRSWSWNASGGADWNWDGDRLGTYLRTGMDAQLLNYWRGGVNVSRSFSTFDDRLTRGGPLARDPAGWSVSLNLGSDFRKPVRLFAFGGFHGDEAGGSGGSISSNVSIKVAERFSGSLGPRFSSGRQVAQYFAAIEDPTAEATFGRRYVFAEIESKSVALETRLNWVFTPELTLELWMQPFVSSNDFGALKELRALRTFDFDVYGEDVGTVVESDGVVEIDPDGAGPAEPFVVPDRDFTLRTVRGNAVLRWEWRPGSSLFLVWQQRRSGFDRTADFSLGDELGALFDPEPDNVFLLKVNYWLNP